MHFATQTTITEWRVHFRYFKDNVQGKESSKHDKNGYMIKRNIRSKATLINLVSIKKKRRKVIFKNRLQTVFLLSFIFLWFSHSIPHTTHLLSY